MVLSLLFAGCNSNKHGESNINSEATSTQNEKIVENQSKTLYDYAPTVDKYIGELLDKGIISYDTKISYDSDGKALNFIYKYKSDYSAIYSVILTYDSNRIITKICAGIIGYSITDEPLSVYLKNFPNSLYGKSNIIKYIELNGKKFFNDDWTSYKLNQSGIDYTFESSYDLNTGRYSYICIIEILPSYEVEDEHTKNNSTSSEIDVVDATDKSNETSSKTTNKANNSNNSGNSSSKTTKKNNDYKEANNISSSKSSCENGHQWKTVDTQTIHHDEVGHYQTVTHYQNYVYKYKCCNCGAVFNTQQLCEQHLETQNHWNMSYNGAYKDIYSFEQIYVDDPYTTQEWIVDEKAYDEIIKKYKCSICGEEKK